MGISDTELVARAQSGDLNAFDGLVNQHQDRVFALAYRMLGNSEDAADVQQETFIQAWKNLHRFRGDAALSTWLHRITVNICLSRRRRPEPVQLDPAVEERLSASDSPNGVSCLVNTETALMVRKVIAGLPPHYRALVVLREIEERSFEEVAHIIGCTPASARTRASKARKLLRERLQPYLSEELL